MIPKKIHYCWFGPKEMGSLEKKCIASWHKFFPNYDFYFWNETNVDLSVPFIKNAYSVKTWAIVSNYVRLEKIYEHGGIYFDTDFEALKKFDFVDDPKLKLFLGYEENPPNEVVNNAMMGSVAKHQFILDSLNFVKSLSGLEDDLLLSSPTITTRLVKKYKKNDKIRHHGIKIFDKNLFYPRSWCNEVADLSDAYACHHGEVSWIESIKTPYDDEINKNLKTDKKKFVFMKVKLIEILNGKISLDTFIRICLNFLKQKIKKLLNL